MNLQTPTVIPYFTAGWPTPDGFQAALKGAARAGCTTFEVGIPFTDPVADGPVIQVTSSEALSQGITVNRALELTRAAVSETGLQAVAMTYANLVYHRGPETFCRQLAEAGGVGLIVPDLALEEAEPFAKAAVARGIDLIQLVAPTTPEARMAELARRTRGFLYLVSVRGVTGERQELPADLDTLIEACRRVSSVPVCVGFGIATPAQAAQVARKAQGVIVGSALLSLMRGVPTAQLEETVYGFLSSLMEAVGAAAPTPP